MKASTYLLDRILGKAAGAKTAPADDSQAPYSEADFEEDEQERDEHRRIFGVLQARQASGARKSV